MEPIQKAALRRAIANVGAADNALGIALGESRHVAKSATRLVRATVQRDPTLLHDRNYNIKAVPPLPVAELIASGNGAQAELLTEFVDLSLFNAAPGFYIVPADTPFLAASAQPTMEFTGEGKPFGCSVPNFDQFALQAIRKIGGVVPVTLGAARRGGSAFEVWLENACLQAANRAANAALLDPSNDGTSDAPAAITHGATGIASSGNPIDDLAALVEDFEGDLLRSILVTDPATALAIDARLGARGQYLSVRLPLLAVRGSPRDSSGGQITLIDPGAVAVAFADAQFVGSENAAIQLESSPDSPATASTVFVSGFQQNLMFYRLVVQLEWRRLLPDAVRYVTGARYSGA